MEILLKYFRHLTDKQIEQFKALESLYKEWNTHINVISRKDIDSLYEKHVLHSLAIAVLVPFPASTKIIDIGTGGGFPGIPLAIYFPSVHFHLVDSINKKLKVIDEVRTALGLHNVTTQHVRAEGITHMKFDYAVSRAVAPLKELWSWSVPLLETGSPANESKNQKGKISPGLICLKGGDLTKEIAESSLQPKIIEISSIFEESFFKEKYLLHVGRK